MQFFFEIPPKFSGFVNSNNCIRKHIKIYRATSSFYSKKDLNFIEIRFFLIEKNRNSGDCIKKNISISIGLQRVFIQKKIL